MGLTLEFFVGNDEKIIKAIQEFNLDSLDEVGCINLKADLSLHIAPNDLDTLSLSASSFNKCDPMEILTFLQPLIDNDDHGLLKVENIWVEYFSKVPTDQVVELAKKWFSGMQDEYPNEKINLSNDGIKAVREFVDLCVFAVKKNQIVYHLWYL